MKTGRSILEILTNEETSDPHTIPVEMIGGHPWTQVCLNDRDLTLGVSQGDSGMDLITLNQEIQETCLEIQEISELLGALQVELIQLRHREIHVT